MDNNTLQKDILLEDYEKKVNYIEEHLGFSDNSILKFNYLKKSTLKSWN